MGTTTPPRASAATHAINRVRRLGGHRWVLGAVVLVMAALVLWPARASLRSVPTVAVRPALPAVVTASTEASAETEPSTPKVRTVQAAGWVEPAPFATAVAGLADGVVRAVHVLEGESVVAGQVLVELDPADADLALARAKAQRGRAAAALALADAERASAQADWDEPVERERSVAVAAAQLEEAEAARDRLPAERREAQAQAQRWRVEVERVEQALSRDAATANELTIAEAHRAAAEARVEALEAEGEARDARVDQWRAELEAAQRAAALRIAERRALDAARAARDLADAELAAADAALAEAQLRRERMTLTAPVAGNVLRRLVAPGDKVMLAMDSPTSAQVVQLYDPAALQVRVDVPLADAAQVYVGQPAEVVVDVLPDATFTGEVTHVTHLADLQKNTLEVKVRVLEPSAVLKPDMLARVRFLGGQTRGATPGGTATPANQAVRVPAASVFGDAVMVVRDRRGLRGRARSVPVQPVTDDANGGPGNGLLTVRGDLRVGDLIVVDPGGLDADQPVRIAEPEAATTQPTTPEGGAA